MAFLSERAGQIGPPNTLVVCLDKYFYTNASGLVDRKTPKYYLLTFFLDSIPRSNIILILVWRIKKVIPNPPRLVNVGK
jgi:hypothetical protein